VSEFGATGDPALLATFATEADRQKVGWAYWSWKYYDDPTGSADEALVMENGRLRQTARVLAQTYPEAIAGLPTTVANTDSSATFRLVYAPNHHIRAPTVIFVPTKLDDTNGYCARVSGGTVTSSPDSELLRVRNAKRSTSVRVTVTAGRCRV
jgi:endoglycosylceramidase